MSAWSSKRSVASIFSEHISKDISQGTIDCFECADPINPGVDGIRKAGVARPGDEFVFGIGVLGRETTHDTCFSSRGDPEVSFVLANEKQPEGSTKLDLDHSAGYERSDHFNYFEDRDISGSLETAREEGRMRELRIIVPATVSAYIFFASGVGIYVFTSLTDAVGLFSYASWFTTVLGVICFLIAIPPTRPRLVRVSAVAFILTALVLSLFSGYSVYGRVVSFRKVRKDDCADDIDGKDCKELVYDIVFYAARTTATLPLAFATCWQWSKHPRSQLNSIWRFIGSCLSIYGLSDASYGILVGSGWYAKNNAPRIETAVVALTSGVFRLILSILLLMPTTRAKTQGFLARRGSALTGAAGIAALLDGETGQEILSKAQKLFRYVTLDKITYEMMVNQEPNPAYYSISKLAQLGEADAFLSHSWHDHAEHKWESLQVWRTTFKERNGREPKLWIDKFCINQSDIVSSLRCLPVFLAGCRKLLIVAGDTYTERLWCVSEIFVFLEMGAELDQLHLIYNGTNIQSLFEFDASLAQCFVPEDEERLKSFIEVACDGIDLFNAHVQEAFRFSWERDPSFIC